MDKLQGQCEQLSESKGCLGDQPFAECGRVCVRTIGRVAWRVCEKWRTDQIAYEAFSFVYLDL